MMLDILLNDPGHVVGTVGLICLSYLVAFLLANRVELQASILLQKIPQTKQDSELEERKKKNDERIGRVTVCLFILFIGVGELVVFLGNKYVKEAFFNICVMVMMSLFIRYICELSYDVFGLQKHSIHRNYANTFVLLKVKEPKHKPIIVVYKGIIISLAFAVNLAAAWKEHPLPFALLSMSMCYFILRTYSTSARQLSFRTSVVIYLCVLGFFLVWIILAVALIMIFNNGEASSKPHPEITEGFWQTLANNYIWIHINAIVAYPAGTLIGFALRFDRELHSLQENDNLVLESVKSFSPQFGEGAVLPSLSSSIGSFPKVYYWVTLVSWVTFHSLIIIATIPFWNILKMTTAETWGVWNTISFLLDIPAVMMVIVIVAAWRGEMKALWSDREGLGIKDEEVTSLKA